MWGEGTVLAGRYELRRRIGGGSMGDVWQAQDTVLSRLVAVKILLPALLDDPGFAARFQTEARVLAALNHPGIVSVHDYGETTDPRTAFLVMELITGRPLSDLLDDSAPLSEAATLTLVSQTLDALQAAHDQGIVHRDVKPANLMLRGGSVVVTDFGVARTADARRLTTADMVLGTAVYAAPEQARHSAVTAAADQYSVGVIAYECLTGAPPFDGDTPLGIMMKHLQEPVPPLPDTVAAPLRDLVLRALAKDPAERFGSAKEMAETARRIAARAASEARIGLKEDSFRAGVGLEADLAAPEGAAEGLSDRDFVSFTVLAKGEAQEPEDAEEAEESKEAGPTGAGEAAPSDGDSWEITPTWASYGVGTPTSGSTDWASFTVRPEAESQQAAEAPSASADGDTAGTVPLPDENEVGTVPLPDGEAESAAGAGAGAAERPGRLVREDSFTAGLAHLDDEQAEVLAAGPAAPKSGRFRRKGRDAAAASASVPEPGSAAVSIPAQDPAEEQASAEASDPAPEQADSDPVQEEQDPSDPAPEQALSDPGQEEEPSDPPPSASEPDPPAPAPEPDPEPDPDPEPEPEPDPEPAAPQKHRSAREDSFTAGVGIASPDTGSVATDPRERESELLDSPALNHRPRTLVFSGVAALVAAVVAAAVVYPLARSDSAASAASAASVSSSAGSGATMGPTGTPSVGAVVSPSAGSVPGSVPSGASTSIPSGASGSPAPMPAPPSSPGLTAPPPPVSVSVSTSQVSKSAAASSHPSGTANPPPSTVGPTKAPSSPPSSAPVSSAQPPPPPPTTVVQRRTGMLTNVGDGGAIDVYGNSTGAPIYTDGSTLGVQGTSNRQGQTFQMTATTVGGQTTYQFGDGLDTNQMIQADGGGKIVLYHCSCGDAGQVWWLSRDSAMPSGAYYVHSSRYGDCLTDNGMGADVSLKPCTSGSKAQQWYLP
ncbi:protein kinase domain-containing protein [Catenulispora yoronensis]